MTPARICALAAAVLAITAVAGPAAAPSAPRGGVTVGKTGGGASMPRWSRKGTDRGPATTFHKPTGQAHLPAAIASPNFHHAPNLRAPRERFERNEHRDSHRRFQAPGFAFGFVGVPYYSNYYAGYYGYDAECEAVRDTPYGERRVYVCDTYGDDIGEDY